MVCRENEKTQKQVRSPGKDQVVSAGQIEKVAVIGAGTIGASWAALFAANGCRVNLQDIEEKCLEQALKTVTTYLDCLAKGGMLNGDPEYSINRILPTTDLAWAVKEVEFVQESVSERYEVKKEVFALIDSVCPEHVILASSSSGLSITEIQKVVKKPQRCLIAHPFNPPHLMPLVELVPGKRTSRETVERAYRFYAGMGKTPLRVKKEVPGHIANRLCAALWREAIDLVDQGVASVKDVDLAVCAGPGLRWALMGPHLIYHLGGGSGGIEEFIEHLGPAYESWWRSMSSWTSIPHGAVEKVVEGVKEEVGSKNMEELCRERDEKLLSILKVLSSS